MSTDTLPAIAGHFALEGSIAEVRPLGEGFINDTFIVRTAGADTPDYILQRKNTAIFADVPAMMENIRKVTAHIRSKVLAAGGDPAREVMTIVPLRSDAHSYVWTDAEGGCWTMAVFIADTVAYDRADTPALARMGGMGIGRFQAQLADFAEPLTATIPGFHDIAFRFKQWDASLAADAAGRAASVAAEIEAIEQRRGRMMEYYGLVSSGVIPSRVTHNDTKINNILFDRSGRVLCVIDLDTVMTAPVHNDFGDAIRTYANTGAEDAADLSTVGLSLPMMEAYTEGYLSCQAAVLTEPELEWLAFSAIYITYEQVLRFLMDYIDGDRYYKVKDAEHNLRRTRAQLRLLESMEANYEAMKDIVARATAKHRSC
ncbi:MAG: aminoglycoside phosphotransferase family protein [Muribaculaceae bacterium]|nr:aminoglycoside phosphotransferase family protein [Muribaculaceae bacterium]